MRLHRKTRLFTQILEQHSFNLNRYAEAKTEYKWLTSHDPVPPIAYYFLAICHDQLGEYLDAGANYNLFLKNADAKRNQLEIDKVNLRLADPEQTDRTKRRKAKEQKWTTKAKLAAGKRMVRRRRLTFG